MAEQTSFLSFFFSAKLERQFQIGTRLTADNEAFPPSRPTTRFQDIVFIYVRVIRDGCLGDNISAVNRQEPLSRLTYIVSKVGRGSRRLYWNGPAGRCAAARPVEFRLASLYQEASSRDFLLFVCFFGVARRMLIHSIHGEPNRITQVKEECLIDAKQRKMLEKRKKKNEAANLVSSVLSPKSPRNNRKKKNQKRIFFWFLFC